jgi:hypothetical protein
LEAYRAVTQFGKVAQKIDTYVEKMQRELVRLRRRKTLIGPDQLKKAADDLLKVAEAVQTAQRAFAILWAIISALPR